MDRGKGLDPGTGRQRATVGERGERMRFDSVQIDSAEPDRVAHDQALLLGVEPLRLHSGAWRFQLERGAVEVEPGAGPTRLRSLRFAVAECGPPPWEAVGEGLGGLELRVTPVVAEPRGGARAQGATGYLPWVAPDPPNDAPERATAGIRELRRTMVEAESVHAIDHVVIRSSDLDRVARVWRDRLGVRLALDRELPGRGLRMLFFRSGGVTLEFVAALGAMDPGGRDALDGVAYAVRDVAACRTRLVAAGLEVSSVRAGFKPGTLVATVRAGISGIPTLLIEQRDSSAPTAGA